MGDRILITGSSGFVGSALLAALHAGGADVLGVSRRVPVGCAPSIMLPSFLGKDDIQGLLNGVDVVIHAAARVHILDERSANPLAEFRKVNTAGTLNVARQAARAGVKRFVFISTVNVNSQCCNFGKKFGPDEEVAPLDPYSLSKYEAEQGLLSLANDTGMEVVIIRSALVYGRGVKGNFGKLIRLVGRGLPLPFGSVDNRRAFISIDNLVSLIVRCIDHPRAVNQVFMASDGDDLAMPRLLRGLAEAMNRRLLLLPVPVWVLYACAKCLGQQTAANRALESVRVDISKTREVLGWAPPLSVEEGLKRCF